MIDRLRDLCCLSGISGREHAVREYLIKAIGDSAVCTTDALGNLIVFKKGESKPKNTVMLAAHMDEVGFLVTFITQEGLLKFTAVGGVDPKVYFGRPVRIGKEGVPGVVGIKPVHLLKDEECGCMPETEALYIDIGARDYETAARYVRVGDSVWFDSNFRQFGDGYIKARALDDRAGCAVLLELIKSDLSVDLHFVFSVQEEVGLRGAKTAAFSVAPEYALVVETTTAADVAGVSEEKQVCRLGSGAVVSFMDRSTVYASELYDRAFEIAEKESIRIQPKTTVAGGNDAGSIHTSRAGVKTLTVSLPCRYLHSPSCVVSESDIGEVVRLVGALAVEFADD